MRWPGCWTPAVLLVASTAAAQPPGSGDLEETLALVGRRVEDYYGRVRTVVSTERVVIQPLQTDLLPAGRGRQLLYEWRVEWEPPAPGEVVGDAQVVRQLLSVNGRPPREGDEPGCIDPRPITLAPLAIFLPGRRNQYAFSWVGTETTDGRTSVVIDYRDATATGPEITWKGECVTIDVPAKTLGRAWVDAETGDVLRLREWFAGLFDVRVPREHQVHGAPMSMTIERNETTIRYRRVTFTDPDETLLLPSTIDTLSIVRNAGTPRLRVTQTFSDYRRFTTGSRVIR